MEEEEYYEECAEEEGDVDCRAIQIGDVEYAVPLLNYDLQAEHPGCPRYIDHEGTLYDKDYFITTVDVKDKENTFQAEAIALKGIPDPANYLSYADYEQALADWKTAAEEALGNVVLPLPLGRYLYRPRLGRSARKTMVLRESPSDSSSKDPAKPGTESDSLSESDNVGRRMSQSGASPVVGSLLAGTEYGASASETALTSSQSDSDRPALSTSGMVAAESIPEIPILRENRELSSDPWEVVLVPPEPAPQDFDSFAEFEAAMLRWATVCTNRLGFLPPHANQLEDIIPIAVPQDNAQRQQEDEAMNVLPVPRKVGLVRMDFWEGSIASDWTKFLASIRDSFLRRPFQRGQLLGQVLPKLPHDLAKQFQAAFDNMLKLKSEMQSKYRMPNAPILPRIHGVSVVPDWIGNKHELNFRNDVLRRSDLSDKERDACKDAPAMIGTRKLDFTLADYDLSSLDYNRLTKDTNYFNRQREELLKLQFKYIYDRLSSWYYPKKANSKSLAYRKETLAQFQATVKAGGKLGLNEVISILESPLYLDEFRQDLLGDDTDTDAGGLLQYGTHLFNAFTAETLPRVLQLYENHKEKRIHAKVSSFIYNGLQNNRSKSMLDSLIEKNDIRSLSLVAYAVVFFNEISIDLFPFREEINELTLHVIGSKHRELVSTIFTYYYLGCIHSVTALEPFQFVAVNSVISKTRETNAKKIVQLLKNNPDFLRTLFKSIGHRSKQVSAVLLFMAVQLLHDNVSGEKGIKSIVRAEMADISNEIKQLARSKFAHARFACRRLMTILKSDEWVDVLFHRFNSQRDFMSLLFDPQQPRNSEFSKQLLDIAMIGLKRTHSLAGELSGTLSSEQTEELEHVAFLLNNVPFHTLLSQCFAHVSAVDERIANIAKLLANVANTFKKLRRVKFDESAQSTAAVATEYSLVLCKKDITELCAFLRNAHGREERFVSAVRTNFLIVLQATVSEESVWDAVKISEEFHNTVSGMCKKTDFAVATEAWKLWYQMIAKHAGAAELFAKHKFLGNYLDLISVSSGMAVMHNAMRYLSKVLSLARLGPKKKDPDVKAVVNYIVASHLFIKIHMIHRKLMDETPGAAFSEMVSFYVTIMTSHSCSKLLKEISKTNDYRDGLQKIKNLLADEVVKEGQAAGSKGSGASTASDSRTATSGGATSSPATKTGDELKKKSSFMDRLRGSKEKDKDKEKKK